MLRTLRPLRFISHNVNMKLVVTALIESVSGILNVVIVILLVWMMFAILGINLMKGKLNYCHFNDDVKMSIYEVREAECAQYGYWTTYDLNFDNIINGMITLFVLSTLEGWPDYMYNFFDADEVGPRYNSQQLFIIYFVSFILIGAFFLLNLFTGVISLSYNMAAAKAKN